MEKRIHAVILNAENLRMIRIRRGPLQAVQDQFLQAPDILAVCVEPIGDVMQGRLLKHFIPAGRNLPLARPHQMLRLDTFFLTGIIV